MGNVECGKALQAAGCNVKCLTSEGDSSLHLAAESGKAEYVTFLMGAGIDPEIVNKKGLKAIDVAKAAKNKECQLAIDPKSGKGGCVIL
jgi:ankyrin repeat protein